MFIFRAPEIYNLSRNIYYFLIYWGHFALEKYIFHCLMNIHNCKYIRLIWRFTLLKIFWFNFNIRLTICIYKYILVFRLGISKFFCATFQLFFSKNFHMCVSKFFLYNFILIFSFVCTTKLYSKIFFVCEIF